jgi:hypothetical protein
MRSKGWTPPSLKEKRKSYTNVHSYISTHFRHRSIGVLPTLYRILTPAVRSKVERAIVFFQQMAIIYSRYSRYSYDCHRLFFLLVVDKSGGHATPHLGEATRSASPILETNPRNEASWPGSTTDLLAACSTESRWVLARRSGTRGHAWNHERELVGHLYNTCQREKSSLKARSSSWSGK